MSRSLNFDGVILYSGEFFNSVPMTKSETMMNSEKRSKESWPLSMKTRPTFGIPRPVKKYALYTFYLLTSGSVGNLGGRSNEVLS